MAIIGTGTEIVECVRIAKMIEAHGEQFLERVYTPNEIEYCLRTVNSNQHFATRWAAKEVRFALSNDALKTTLTSGRSFSRASKSAISSDSSID